MVIRVLDLPSINKLKEDGMSEKLGNWWTFSKATWNTFDVLGKLDVGL